MRHDPPRSRNSIRLLTLVTALLLPALPARADDVPADGWIVWMSLRDKGRAESFRCRADGTEVTQLTKTGSNYPIWSPDGRWIAYHDLADQSHLMRPDGSNDRLISGLHVFWMHDNAGLLVLDGPNDSGYVLDPDTGDKTPFFKLSEFAEFQNTLTNFYAMTHDRRYMMVGSGLYDYGYQGANGFFQQSYSISLIDMLDKRKIYLVHLGCWAFTPPAGNLVYHIRGDGLTWPDIYRLNLADILTLSSYEPEVSYPDPDWGHEYHPQISNDNQWLVYMTSQGCHWDYQCNNEIFIHRVGSGTTSRTRVTYDESFDAFPSIYIGKPWSADDPPRLVLSPNRITFFARNAAVPEARTVLAKSSAADSPAVSAVTATPSVSWLDASVVGNKITVGLRKGQIWRGRCQANVTVTVPGLLGSPAEIPIIVDADETFPEPPVAGHDAGAIEVGMSSVDGSSIDVGSIDAGISDHPVSIATVDANATFDVPVPCDVPVESLDAGVGPVTTPIKPAQDSGCGCAMGRASRDLGAGALLLLVGLLLRRSRLRRE
jgi:hypothetical protein